MMHSYLPHSVRRQMGLELPRKSFGGGGRKTVHVLSSCHLNGHSLMVRKKKTRDVADDNFSFSSHCKPGTDGRAHGPTDGQYSCLTSM